MKHDPAVESVRAQLMGLTERERAQRGHVHRLLQELRAANWELIRILREARAWRRILELDKGARRREYNRRSREKREREQAAESKPAANLTSVG